MLMIPPLPFVFAKNGRRRGVMKPTPPQIKTPPIAFLWHILCIKSLENGTSSTHFSLFESDLRFFFLYLKGSILGVKS